MAAEAVHLSDKKTKGVANQKDSRRNCFIDSITVIRFYLNRDVDVHVGSGPETAGPVFSGSIVSSEGLEQPPFGLACDSKELTELPLTMSLPPFDVTKAELSINYLKKHDLKVPTAFAKSLLAVWQLDAKTQETSMDCTMFVRTVMLLTYRGGHPERLTAPKPYTIRSFVRNADMVIIHSAICIDPVLDIWLSKMGRKMMYVFSCFSSLQVMYPEATTYVDTAFTRPSECQNPGCNAKKEKEKEKEKRKIRCCARCYDVGYCSKECQAMDWKEHKQLCDPYFHEISSSNETLMKLVRSSLSASKEAV